MQRSRRWFRPKRAGIWAHLVKTQQDGEILAQCNHYFTDKVVWFNAPSKLSRCEICQTKFKQSLRKSG